MPLFNGLALLPIAETIQENASAIFSILLTNDYFSSYLEYINRVRHLQSPVFQCVATMATGLSYPDALTSELRAIHTIRRLPSFIIPHFMPILADNSIFTYIQNSYSQSDVKHSDIMDSKHQYLDQIWKLYDTCLHELPFIGEPILLSNKRVAIVVYGSSLFSIASKEPEQQQNASDSPLTDFCIAVEISGSLSTEFMNTIESILGDQLNEELNSIDSPCFTYTDNNSGLRLYFLDHNTYYRASVAYSSKDNGRLDSSSVYLLTSSKFEYLCLLLRYFLNSKGIMPSETHSNFFSTVDKIITKIGQVSQSVRTKLKACVDLKDVEEIFSSRQLDIAGMLELYTHFLDMHVIIHPILANFQTGWLFDSWNRAVHTFYPLRPDSNLLELIATMNTFKPQVMGANVSIKGKINSYEIDGQKFFIEDSLTHCEVERRIPIRISFVPDPHNTEFKKYLDKKKKVKRQNESSVLQDESDSKDNLVTPSRQGSSGRKSRDSTGKKTQISSTKSIKNINNIKDEVNENNEGIQELTTIDTVTSSGHKRSGEKIKGKRAPNGCRTINGEIVRLKDQVTMELQPECMQIQSRLMLKDDMDILDCPPNEAQRADILLHDSEDTLVSIVEDSDCKDNIELKLMLKSVEKASGFCQILYPCIENIHSLYKSSKDVLSPSFQAKYKYTRPPDTQFYTPFRDDTINRNSVTMSRLMSVWTFLQTNALFLKLPFISIDDFSAALDVTDQIGYKNQLQYRSLTPEELKQAEEEDIKEYYFEKYGLMAKKDQLAPIFPIFNGDLVSPLLYLIMSRLISLLYDGEEEIMDEVPYEYIQRPSLMRRSSAKRTAKQTGSNSQSITESVGSVTEVSTAYENASSDDVSSPTDFIDSKQSKKQRDRNTKKTKEETESTIYEYSYLTYSTSDYSSTDNDAQKKQQVRKKPPSKSTKKQSKQQISKASKRQSISNDAISKRNKKNSSGSEDNDSYEYSYTEYTYTEDEQELSSSDTSSSTSLDDLSTSNNAHELKKKATGKRNTADTKPIQNQGKRSSTRSLAKEDDNITEAYYCSTDISYTDEWVDIDGSKDTYWCDQALQYLLLRIGKEDQFIIILRILPIFFKLKIKYHEQLEKLASALLRTILSSISSDNLFAAILNECVNPITSYSKEEEQEAITFIKKIAISKEERMKEREEVVVRQKGKRTVRMTKSSKYKKNNAQNTFKDSLADFFIVLQELHEYGEGIYHQHQHQEPQSIPNIADNSVTIEADQTADDDQETNTIDYRPPTSVVSGQDTIAEEPKIKKGRAKDRFIEYMPYLPSILLSVAPTLHRSVCLMASYILKNTHFILFLKRLFQYVHFSRAKQRPTDYSPSHIRFHQLTVQEKLEVLNYFIHQVSETENYHTYLTQRQSYNDSISSMSKELESILCLHFSPARREARRLELEQYQHKYEEVLDEAKKLCLEKARSVSNKWKEFAEIIGVTPEKLAEANLLFEDLDADELSNLPIDEPSVYQKYTGFQTPEHVDSLKKLIDTKGGSVTLANQQIRGFNMHLIRAISSCSSALTKYKELKTVLVNNKKFNPLYHEQLDYEQFKAIQLIINAEIDNRSYALDTADIHTDWYMNQFFLLPAEYGYLTVADLNYMVVFSDSYMRRNGLSYKFRKLSHKQLLKYVEQLCATPREKILKEWVKQMDGLIINYQLTTSVRDIIKKMGTATRGYETIQKIIGVNDVDIVKRWMAEYEEKYEQTKTEFVQRTEWYSTERIMVRMEQMGVPSFSTKRAYLTSIAGALRLSHNGIRSFLKNDI